MNPLTFRVHGDPRPQGGMDIARNKANTKQWLRHHEDGKLKAWRGQIGYAARLAAGHAWQAPPIDVAVVVVATFYYARPKYHYGTGRNSDVLRAGVPAIPIGGLTHDADKLARGLLDALTIAEIITDDAQVSDVIARRRWDKHPGAYVMLFPLPEDATP